MVKSRKDLAALLRKICVLFVLICIFFAIFPHAHSCSGEECAICAFIRIFADCLFVVAFFGLIPYVLWGAVHLAAVVEQTGPFTLVHLKVKLSD